MNVTIIETNEKKSLNISDLLGNHDALPEYDDESDSHLMSQEDYDWWADLIDRYQEADDRFFELCQELDEDEANELKEAAMSISVDLENYPEALQAACDEAEGDE
jgi:hypothetical protein